MSSNGHNGSGPVVEVYDTTLRDGTQMEGLSLSCEDKLRIAEHLDALGVDFIEGGWPGSNPKDVEFFERAKDIDWKNVTIAAFGSTCRTPITRSPAACIARHASSTSRPWRAEARPRASPPAWRR